MRLQNDTRPWYKERWPWLLMAGPFIVMVAGFTTAWLAVISNDGLVADDYYKQGLAINQQLHRDQKADDLGLHAQLMRSGNQIRVMISANGEVALPERLVLHVAHPTRAGMDEVIEMQSGGHGFFVGKLSNDISGRWHVVLEDPSGQWRLHGEWQADAVEPLRLGAGESTSTINRNVTGR